MNMINRFLIILLIGINIFVCSQHHSRLEQALKLADDNRAELEKVLSHYSDNPADSLKYRAAVFLIENMPYHYELYHEKLDMFRSYLEKEKEKITKTTVASFITTYGNLPFRYSVRRDIHCMKADYLIRNIEFSFKIWQTMPWGKHIPFDTFCEEILPYRIDNEPIEDWKEIYYQTFYPMIDSIVQECDFEKISAIVLNSLSPDVSAWSVNINGIWIQDNNVNVPGLGAPTLLKALIGTCKEQSELITYVLRSLGIPAGIDMFLQHVESRHRRHSWNYIRMLDGKDAIISSFKLKDELVMSSTDRRCGKIYRCRYARQEESLLVKHQDIPLPENFKSPLLQDVSDEYFPDTHISINKEDLAVKNGDIIYLNVYDGAEWIPVAWTDNITKVVVFKHVEQSILYRLSTMSGRKIHFVTEPFLFTEKGIIFPQADSKHLQNMRITRKCKLMSWANDRRGHAIGGRFQGANKADFSDFTDLHVITDSATLLWTSVPVEHSDRYRHVRYLGADYSRNNMAEIEFISSGVVLQGQISGTEGSFENDPQRTKDKVLDGAPLTFFEGPTPSDSWAGLTFDSPQKIDTIRYIFRNDDNNIRPGDEYELFYWDKRQWNSLGRKIGDESCVLVYENIPSGALYWLRNHTRGKEERPFNYENGKQFFW
jgi:hypothetical protein